MNGWVAAGVALLLTGAAPPSSEKMVGSTLLDFDADQAGAEPAGFVFARTGGGRAGRWIVRAEKDAPSPPNVLAQIDGDPTDYRFPVAVASAVSLRDLRLSVKCKPISGSVDQACGVVFRYLDESHYYIARANALEGNIRLYAVRGGRRRQIASYSGPVTANAWHELAAEAEGATIRVFWDRRNVLSADDSTFDGPGKVGLWTKADSVTYFDDLTAAPLRSSAGPS